VRAYRTVDRRAEREQAVANQAARELNYYHDDDGCLVIRARLPAEQGAVVLQAIAEGRLVFDAAPTDKQFLDMRGGHNDGFIATGQAYSDRLSRFIESLLD